MFSTIRGTVAVGTYLSGAVQVVFRFLAGENIISQTQDLRKRHICKSLYCASFGFECIPTVLAIGHRLFKCQAIRKFKTSKGLRSFFVRFAVHILYLRTFSFEFDFDLHHHNNM
jgi:hypothetical protein